MSSTVPKVSYLTSAIAPVTGPLTHPPVTRRCRRREARHRLGLEDVLEAPDKAAVPGSQDKVEVRDNRDKEDNQDNRGREDNQGPQGKVDSLEAQAEGQANQDKVGSLEAKAEDQVSQDKADNPEVKAEDLVSQDKAVSPEVQDNRVTYRAPTRDFSATPITATAFTAVSTPAVDT